MKLWNILGWIVVALNIGLIIYVSIRDHAFTVNPICVVIIILLAYLLWKNYKLDKEDKNDNRTRSKP